MIDSLGMLAYEVLIESFLVSALLWIVTVTIVRLFRITDPTWRVRFFVLPLVIPVLAVPLAHFVVRPLFLVSPRTPLENLLTSLAGNLPLLTTVSLVVAGLLSLKGVIKAIRPVTTAGLLRYRWQRQPHSKLWRRCHRILKSAATDMKISPPRLVLTSGNTCGSIFLGPLGSYVVVARFLVPKLDDEELKSLLAHELLHIKRKDTLTSTMVGICRHLLTLSPFAQGAYRRFCRAREEKVDSLAIGYSGEPLAMASCLVKACRFSRGHCHHFALGNGFISSMSATENRIKRLLDNQAGSKTSDWHRWTFLGTIMVVVAFMIFVI